MYKIYHQQHRQVLPQPDLLLTNEQDSSKSVSDKVRQRSKSVPLEIAMKCKSTFFATSAYLTS